MTNTQIELLKEAAKLLVDIVASDGLKQGGEQYPNALNCYEVANRLDDLRNELEKAY